MTRPKELIFITGNRSKLREVQAILADTIDLQTRSLDLVEIQGTIEEISKDKARRAAAVIKSPVIVEDTCLCFKALKDLPGPYIKWFFTAIGLEGLNNLLAAFPDKSAEAVCTFAYCEGPDHEPIIFQGRTFGMIVAPRGPTHFGFDPIFEYEGKTYAEMDGPEKNKISHRFRALEKLKIWLQQEA